MSSVCGSSPTMGPSLWRRDGGIVQGSSSPSSTVGRRTPRMRPRRSASSTMASTCLRGSFCRPASDRRSPGRGPACLPSFRSGHASQVCGPALPGLRLRRRTRCERRVPSGIARAPPTVADGCTCPESPPRRSATRTCPSRLPGGNRSRSEATDRHRQQRAPHRVRVPTGASESHHR